jgi:hypothetical protein
MQKSRAYASQQECVHQRGLQKAQKIRRPLNGIADRPKGMHWRTYDRLRAQHDAADNRSLAGLVQFLNRQTRAPIS